MSFLVTEELAVLAVKGPVGTATKCRAYIGRSDGIAVPGDAEHAVAAGLDDKFVFPSLDSLAGNDVFDAAIATPASSDSLERRAVGGEYHCFAIRVPFNCILKSEMNSGF